MTLKSIFNRTNKGYGKRVNKKKYGKMDLRTISNINSNYISHEEKEEQERKELNLMTSVAFVAKTPW